MPTSCPIGVLDVLCLDDEHGISPTFTQMMRCVHKGRAIVLSRFYCETTSSHCTGEDAWGLSALDSERLAAELGDKTLPPLTYQSLSILEEMIEHHRNGCYKELQNCILNMVPTRRQLLLVFQTTQETWTGYNVDQLNKLYWAVSKATLDYNYEVSRST
jgi:hypothetical protein